MGSSACGMGIAASDTVRVTLAMCYMGITYLKGHAEVAITCRKQAIHNIGDSDKSHACEGQLVLSIPS